MKEEEGIRRTKEVLVKEDSEGEKGRESGLPRAQRTLNMSQASRL